MFEMLKNLAMPSQFVALLLVVGVGMLVAGRTRRIGIRLLVAGSLLLLFFSSGLTASLLMRPLEYRYGPVVDLGRYADVDTIVVQTAFATDDRNMPLSSRAGSSTVYRVLEVARLVREGSVTSVFVSGDPVAAPIIRDLLISVGVPGEMIAEDANSHHTVESAENLAADLAGRRFYLVTSAGHMPRALGVIRKATLDPVPAPTDFQLPSNPAAASWWPSPYHLYVSDLAVREYLGLLWYRVTGKTDSYW